MDRRAISIVIVLVILALAGTACESGYSSGVPYATPRPPSALEMAARETTIAQETRQAMENYARGTAEALANERQATQQVMDLNATQQAQEAGATQAAWEFAKTQTMEAVQATATVQEAVEARQATATQQAIDGTATATSAAATATARQWAANVQGTQAAVDAQAVQATGNAIGRADFREQITQPFRAWWGWVLLVIVVPCLLWLGWKAAKTIEKRKALYQGDPTKGEVITIDTVRDEDGQKRTVYGLLGRVAGDRLDPSIAGLLPTPEMQEAAVMRQQTVNAIQARQTAATVKARKAHKSKAPRILAQQPVQPALPARTRRRRAPGLVKVVSVESLNDAIREGILSPRLAETIEGQWTVVDEEA